MANKIKGLTITGQLKESGITINFRTEEALQEAAASYGGLTKDRF